MNTYKSNSPKNYSKHLSLTKLHPCTEFEPYASRMRASVSKKNTFYQVFAITCISWNLKFCSTSDKTNKLMQRTPIIITRKNSKSLKLDKLHPPTKFEPRATYQLLKKSNLERNSGRTPIIITTPKITQKI